MPKLKWFLITIQNVHKILFINKLAHFLKDKVHLFDQLFKLQTGFNVTSLDLSQDWTISHYTSH